MGATRAWQADHLVLLRALEVMAAPCATAAWIGHGAKHPADLTARMCAAVITVGAVLVALAWFKLPGLQLAELLTRAQASVLAVAAAAMLFAAWRAALPHLRALLALSAILAAAAASLLPSWRTTPMASALPLATGLLCCVLLPWLAALRGAPTRASWRMP